MTGTSIHLSIYSVVRFCASTAGLRPHPIVLVFFFFSVDRSKAVPLLQFFFVDVRALVVSYAPFVFVTVWSSTLLLLVHGKAAAFHLCVF